MADDLTTLQRKFVEEYVANGFKNAKDAALKAGAAESTAKNAYENFLGSAVVVAELDAIRDLIRTASRDKLLGGADKGIEALLDVLGDEKSPAAAKVNAAKAIIEMSGVSLPEKMELSGGVGLEISDRGRAFLDRLARLASGGEDSGSPSAAP